MGVAVGDPDNDGDLDMFVTNITGESHAFYVNLGQGAFEDRRLAAGLAAPTLPYTGFGTDWFDYDNDGRLDLFVANGAVTIIEALRGDPFPFRQRNQLLRNIGGGRFRDATAEAGSGAAARRGQSRCGVRRRRQRWRRRRARHQQRRTPSAAAERDGSRRQLAAGAARGCRGQPPGSRRASGPHDERRRTIWRRAHTDGSYLSASDPRVHFGLGARAADVTGRRRVAPRRTRRMDERAGQSNRDAAAGERRARVGTARNRRA